MKKALLLSASLFILITNSFAQIGIPKIHEGDPYLPSWVSEMYKEKPNAWMVDKGYYDHVQLNGKKTSVYEAYYKRWRRYAQQFINEEGYVIYPTQQELNDRNEFLKAEKLNNERGSTYWTAVGPKIHYLEKTNVADSLPKYSDHTNVYSISIHEANPNIMYCGTESGGVYKSTNKGSTWTHTTSNDNIRDVKAIEVHPTNPNVVLFGANGNIYKSTNAGVSWYSCGQAGFQSLNIYTWDLHFNPANPNMVFAATNNGLYRSPDMGENWYQVMPRECISVQHKVDDPSVIFTIQYNNLTEIGDFYKSLDSGLTFTIKPTGWFTVPVGDEGLIESKGGKIATTAADPNRIYCLLVGQSNVAATLQLNGYIGVYVSTNAGETWNNPDPTMGSPYDQVTNPNPMTFSGDDNTYNQIYYNTTIAANQLNADEFIFGGLSLWRSTDAGATISPVGGYVGSIPHIHPDMQEIKIRKTGASSQDIWVATDGGINYSINMMNNHVAKNDGILGADFWGFDQGWNEDVMVGGRYHNGNAGYYETYPAGSFLAIGGGEASTGYVNYSNERKTICSDIDGTILPTVITGVTTNFGCNLDPNEGYWLNESSRFQYDNDYWNVVYAGKDNKIYKSMDGGSSFSDIYTFGASGNDVLWLEECKMYPDVLYAQVVEGSYSKIYKTTDAGNTWNTITIPQTNRRYLFFSLAANNPNELWLAYTNGSNGFKVYHTTNSGTSWDNITTSTLNGYEIYQCVHQYGTNGGVYVATKEGLVFYRDNSMPDWMNYSAGLPVGLEPLKMVPFYKNGVMRLSSKGFAIWEAPFYSSSSLLADFAADYKEFHCPGDTVKFVDHSVCSSTATYQWQFPGGSPSTSTAKYPNVVYATTGTYDVTLIVTDGAQVDTVSKTTFISSSTSVGGTLAEGFETGGFLPSGWQHGDDGNDNLTWMLNNSVGGYSLSTKAAYFDNYYNDVQGKKDKLLTAKIDFSALASPQIKFDVAYARYDVNYSDTLAVYYSTDCGSTFNQIYIKGGTLLSTSPDNSNYFTPTAVQWRTDSIDLSPFNITDPEVIFAFENRGHYGNAIYLDNINIDGISTIGMEEEEHFGVLLYPNPAHQMVMIPSNEAIEQLIIYNQLGQICLMDKNVNSFSVESLATGTYVVVLMSNNQMIRQKLVVQH